MAIATFRLKTDEQSNFQDLRKTLILLPGVHSAEIHPEELSIRFDPEVTDLSRVRSLIALAGFSPEGPRILRARGR